jgi:menaquinone-dependent protoporphyrinogen oxidase
MMKSLILYATSHGASRTAAEFVSQKLTGAETVDLKNGDIPDLASYDTIILGGSIHMGKIQSCVRKFIEKQRDILVQKRLGLFLCCMYEGDTAQRQFDDAFPQALRDAAVAKSLFGGGFDFPKMNFVERMIVKKVAGVTKSVSSLNHEEMERFAEAMKVTT